MINIHECLMIRTKILVLSKCREKGFFHCKPKGLFSYSCLYDSPLWKLQSKFDLLYQYLTKTSADSSTWHKEFITLKNGVKIKRTCQFLYERPVSCNLKLLVAVVSNPIIQCNFKKKVSPCISDCNSEWIFI